MSEKNKLRVERKDVYEIEVNDKGETIVFYMGDVTLPLRMNKAYEEIDKIQKWMKAQIVVINKKKDYTEKGSAMSHNNKEIMKVYEKGFADMRKAMDVFLGDGGCQKVFGDSDYLEMYDDLWEELTRKQEDGLSHLDKMQLSTKAITQRIESKYQEIKKQRKAQAI